MKIPRAENESAEEVAEAAEAGEHVQDREMDL